MTSPCQGLFPPASISKGKALGTRLPKPTKLHYHSIKIPNGPKALNIIKHNNKILNLQNYKITLSSHKNIIILYNIITNFKKPCLELRFKKRKRITRSKFERKCIPNRRCGNSKRPATISFKIKFRCRK